MHAVGNVKWFKTILKEESLWFKKKGKQKSSFLLVLGSLHMVTYRLLLYEQYNLFLSTLFEKLFEGKPVTATFVVSFLCSKVAALLIFI